MGTHNSYHEYPQPPIDGIEQLQYFEDPLDVQLQSQGVRQFELDVHVNIAPAGTFSVLHIEGVDENTTCKAFVDCLNTIKAWSDAHPRHIPIGIQLELKNADLALPNLPYRPWVASDLDTLDATIRSVFTGNRLFAPDDLRHDRATLPQAIAQDGWPTLDATRGKVMFVMDNSGTFRDWYRTGHDALQGRVIFTNADPGDADAAFIKTQRPEGRLRRHPVADRAGLHHPHAGRRRHGGGAGQRHDVARRRVRERLHVGEQRLRRARSGAGHLRLAVRRADPRRHPGAVQPDQRTVVVHVADDRVAPAWLDGTLARHLGPRRTGASCIGRRRVWTSSPAAW